MLNRCSGFLMLFVVLSLSLGCSSALEENWGKSVEQAKEFQTVNPGAGQNPGPVVGLDGKVAERAITNYREGKREDQETSSAPVFTLIPMGTSGS